MWWVLIFHRHLFLSCSRPISSRCMWTTVRTNRTPPSSYWSMLATTLMWVPPLITEMRLNVSHVQSPHRSPLLMTGNSTEAPTGQLHLILSDQASAENHQVSAPAEGKPPQQKNRKKRDACDERLHGSCCHGFCARVLFRSCWRAVKKVKERSRTAWRWCSVFPRKPTMPCTSQCWKVSHWFCICTISFNFTANLCVFIL